MDFCWYCAVAVLVCVVSYLVFVHLRKKPHVEIGSSVMDGTRSLLIRSGFVESTPGRFVGGSDFEGLGSAFTLEDASARVSASLLGAMTASNQ